MSAILEIDKVDQHFRVGFWMTRVQILKSISLSVKKGSIFGFLGANGAGKTTLIHLIVGLRSPTQGMIRVAGLDVRTLEAKAKLGYLPERPYFHDYLTGEELLKYVGTLSGMSRSKILARIPQVLADVGMNDARKIELRKYSKGMLQRIGIAQAMLHDPELLVLDEPMSGLDPIWRKEMRDLIVRLAAEGRTIFFSTHLIPDVEAICDQVGLIQKGRLIGCGPIGQFLASGPLLNEVAFSGISLEKAKTMGEFVSIRPMPDGIRAIVPSQTAVAELLKKLLEAKAHILWVQPIRPSLEEFFVRTQKSMAASTSGQLEEASS
jgi:ABC-2 type transport system ATP-binding protein